MLPDFIIVGAMKAGTTTYHHHLAEIGAVFIPDHEVKFFSNDAAYARGLGAYEQMFASADATRVVGERTTTYSYVPSVPKRIHRHLPAVKLVWMFREPVSRAYSNYWHSVNAGSERLGFEEAVAREPERIKRDIFRGYVQRSLYAEQVERYLEYFPRENMLFLLFEEFIRDPSTAVNRTLNFLGVDHVVGAVAPKHSHRTYAPQSLRVQWLARKAFGKRKPFRLVSRLNRQNVSGYPRMSDQVRAELKERFRDPNRRLAQVTGLDLGAWDTTRAGTERVRQPALHEASEGGLTTG
jgi:hypothetical protein